MRLRSAVREPEKWSCLADALAQRRAAAPAGSGEPAGSCGERALGPVIADGAQEQRVSAPPRSSRSGRPVLDVADPRRRQRSGSSVRRRQRADRPAHASTVDHRRGWAWLCQGPLRRRRSARRPGGVRGVDRQEASTCRCSMLSATTRRAVEQMPFDDEPGPGPSYRGGAINSASAVRPAAMNSRDADSPSMSCRPGTAACSAARVLTVAAARQAGQHLLDRRAGRVPRWPRQL